MKANQAPTQSDLSDSVFEDLADTDLPSTDLTNAPALFTCTPSLSGETYIGRLRPCQEILVQLLADRRGDTPSVIVDIGIGDGAPTFVKDLVEVVGNTALQDTVLVAIDKSRTRLQHAAIALEKIDVPSNISQVLFLEGDIAASARSSKSIQSVLKKHLPDGVADLVVSSNLLNGLQIDISPVVSHLRETLRENGLLAIGSGGIDLNDYVACGGLDYKIFPRVERGPAKLTIQARDYLPISEYPEKRSVFLTSLYDQVATDLRM